MREMYEEQEKLKQFLREEMRRDEEKDLHRLKKIISNPFNLHALFLLIYQIVVIVFGYL